MGDGIFKDGDVFYWSWLDPKRSYHCCSGKAIYKNGRIVDTFWPTGNNRSWTPEEARKEIDFEFKGNLVELVEIPRSEKDHYHHLDVTDLAHSNNSGAKVYKRPEAKKDRHVMLCLAEYRLERARSDLMIAQRRVEEFTALVKKIAEMDEDVQIPDYWWRS